MESGDVATLMSLVTDDVMIKPPGAPPIAGKTALQDALSAFLAAHSETVQHDLLEVEVSGTLAFACILERATILPSSGADASSVNGMHLSVLRQQPDGSWLLARDVSALTDPS